MSIDPEIKKWLEKIKKKHNCKTNNEVFIILRDAYNIFYTSPKDRIRSDLYDLQKKYEGSLTKFDEAILEGTTAAMVPENPVKKTSILTSIKRRISDLRREDQRKTQKKPKHA